MTLLAHVRIGFVLDVATLKSFRMGTLSCSIGIHLFAG